VGEVYQQSAILIDTLLQHFHEEQILSRSIDRIGYASDASFYRLIPEVVVQPKTDEDIQNLFRIASDTQRPLVFRAAGTSLSGQSITDGILVDLSKHWREYEIYEEEQKIRLEPGVIGEHANLYLKKFGQKIGPDPASISTCQVGGIIANNASGMCCGVAHNSYHTLADIQFILPNGNRYNSKEAESRERFLQEEDALVAKILEIKKRIEGDADLEKKIRQKYQRKNTTGYSLNAFIDYDDPFDIFCHLLVGSEGTLAFISNVTLNTLPDLPHKGTALLVFPTLKQAVSAVPVLEKLGAEAVELMDRASLKSVENQSGIPPEIKTVSEEGTALLVEFQAQTDSALEELLESAKPTVDDFDLEFFTGFSQDPKFQSKLWKIRKGLYPSVGAVRKSGTAVIIEDIAFPLEHLAEATQKVRGILDQHQYTDGVIFGHAKEGNLHFVISQEFDEAGVDQYRQLIDEIVALVVDQYDGSLKAEHGTGRNMAPFVETEWGPELYRVMRELKSVVDPGQILNPGVIINDNTSVHLEDIKPLPSVESIVDKCVECGFCEPVCPSRDLTTTPRRRIVIWREITRLQDGLPSEKRLARELLNSYEYDSIDTCAADGMCSTACPVDIDTGKMMKLLRKRHASEWQKSVAIWTVDNFSFVASALKFGLTAASGIQKLIGREQFNNLMTSVHDLSHRKIPAWNPYFPTGNWQRPKPVEPAPADVDVIYFTSCLNNTMDGIPEEENTANTRDVFCELMHRAHLRYAYPQDRNNLCCGTPWSSKGYTDAYRRMAERTTTSLFHSSKGGQIPIVMDTSPCSYSVKHYDEILEGEILEKWQQLTVYDLTRYLYEIVLPKLSLHKIDGAVVCHPTCSTMKMEEAEMLHTIAAQCATEAITPTHHSCCGFAGDRGLLFPELTASATSREAADVTSLEDIQGYYSTSRTCEVGMSSATGHPYQSIVHLVEQASRPQ